MKPREIDSLVTELCRNKDRLQVTSLTVSHSHNRNISAKEEGDRKELRHNPDYPILLNERSWYTHAADSTGEDTVSLRLYQEQIHYSERGQRYVCHFLLDPVSTEATRFTAVTHLYAEEKMFLCTWFCHLLFQCYLISATETGPFIEKIKLLNTCTNGVVFLMIFILICCIVKADTCTSTHTLF